MCGIYGYIGRNFLQVSSSVEPLLRHRGPDAKGVFLDHSSRLVLGHTRLSIIDLSAQAGQPMLDPSQSHVLTFNGEIYNYQDIRRELQALGFVFLSNSDTEVVLKGYMAWGEDCIHRFRGMFAFCVYDSIRKELFLARDRFGIKPLTYAFFEGQFMFSSELKPFFHLPFFTSRIDPRSLSDYFQYGAVRQPRTILDGVSQLMPGHTLRVGLDLSSQRRQYYDLVRASRKVPPITRYEDAVEAVRDALETATRYHMVADVEVGAFLSGGVDSSTVVALMKQCSASQVNTFSIGFKERTGVVDETDVAGRTARVLGTRHHRVLVDDAYIFDIFEKFLESLDQPSVDGINTYIVSKETAKELKVALSGLGGDEVFAGYPHFATIPGVSRQRRHLGIILAQLVQGFFPNAVTRKYDCVGLPEEVLLDKVRSFHGRLGSVLRGPGVAGETLKVRAVGLSPVQRICKAEIDTYLLSTLLRDSDALSMAHSLEVRPVLLDHKLVELVFALEDGFKVRNGQMKSVLVDSVKDLVPAEVWQRRKTGFDMPLASWMNRVLNMYCRQVFYGSHARNLFTKKHLRGLRKRADARMLQRRDWLSLTFLMWMEKNGVTI